MCNDHAINQIHERLQELDSERNELETALRVLKRLAQPEDEQVYPDVHIDFKDAKNLGQRLTRIAEAVSVPMDAKEMAICLIQRGESKAALRNLHAHVINELRENPDFDKSEDGSYLYLPKVTLQSSCPAREQL